MKKIKKVISLGIVLFIFWIGFALQDFSINKINLEEILVGGVISILIAFFMVFKLFHYEEGKVFKKFFLINILRFIPIYICELIKANVDVAKRSLSKNLNISPGIIKYKSFLKSDLGLGILSNSITLTPGTITLDIYLEEGENFLYIHSIDVDNIENLKSGIKERLENNIGRFLN